MITLPLVIALLITALVSPAVNAMTRAGLPRGLASILMVIGGLAAIAALLTFAGQQVATGAEDLADSTVEGLGKIRQWLQDGPLNASDSQIEEYIQTAQDAIRDQTNDGALKSVGEIGTAVGHVFAGFFIILFSTFFFLADGDRIWAWLVRIAPQGGPRAGRQLGPGGLDLADPVRARDGDRGAGRLDRHHDRRGHPAASRSCSRSACSSSSARSSHSSVPLWPAAWRCSSRWSTRGRSPRC